MDSGGLKYIFFRGIQHNEALNGNCFIQMENDVRLEFIFPEK